MLRSAPCRRLVFRAVLLCGMCVANLSASTNPVTAGSNYDWHELLTNKAFACGAAAVVLFVVSLLLRGILKAISLAIVILLAGGTYWYFRDSPVRHAELLPREWTILADKTLRLPKAQESWNALLTDLSHQPHDFRVRLSVGADDARQSFLTKIDSRVAELRKSRRNSEAEELRRLGDLISKAR